MAFVRLAFFPGGTAAHYRALLDELVDAPDPPERLVFAAGAVDGGWQVVQVWEDRAALDAFNEAWLGPAYERAGDRAFPQRPEVRDVPDAEITVRPG